MNQLFKLLTGLTLVLSVIACTPKNTSSVSSPDGNITYTLKVDKDGGMSYTVAHHKKALVRTSKLGFAAQNNINLLDGYQITEVEKTAVDSVWTQPWGENKEVREHYNGAAIHLENAVSKLTVYVKVFNDGLGFRYAYDVAGQDSLFLTDEQTEFDLVDCPKTWSTPAHFDTYEQKYRTLPLDSVQSANTPITMCTTAGSWVSIHEAALTDFPGMTLKRKEAKLPLEADLVPWPDGIKAKVPAQFKTPWRSIQIADEAPGLINSSLIINLNDPCKIEDTAWVKPIKYVGVWWGMHVGVETWTKGPRHGATTENAKKYIDFAVDHDIEGVLFEGWNDGWENWGTNQVFDYMKPYDDFDVYEVQRYAQEKGIYLITHHETGGNIANYESQLERTLAWNDSLGVRYLKTGYAGGMPNGVKHHSQPAVMHYRKVVELAAKYRININAHEPIKPTGIRRTYPNMMTREGARGMEWNAWSEGNGPEYFEVLPFTRLLAGPMDYTPGIFDVLLESSKNDPRRKKWNSLDKGTNRVHTTVAKQMAAWVVLYSPMQMASDMIDNYKGKPAFQFFEDFDADSDWSKCLVGEPEKTVVVVRRAGNRFFLGAVANDFEAKKAVRSVKLDFLEEGMTYEMTVYEDAPNTSYLKNPTGVRIIKKAVQYGDSIFLNMGKGGGAAVSFIPTVRVMSLNIRMDNPDDGINAWPKRVASMKKMLAAQQPDIIGTQEVLHHQLVTMKEEMLPDYYQLGVGREDGAEKGEYSALFIKKARFDVLQSATYSLSHTPDQFGKRGWDAACCRVATWALLRDTHSQDSMLVVNTHLDHVGKEARVKGVQLIHNQLATLLKTWYPNKDVMNTLPIFITGDFNAEPNSKAVQYLVEKAGYKDSRVESDIVTGPTWTYHGFGHRAVAERARIDYILYSPNCRPLSYAAIADQPNEKGIYVTDHLPVTADFVM